MFSDKAGVLQNILINLLSGRSLKPQSILRCLNLNLMAGFQPIGRVHIITKHTEHRARKQYMALLTVSQHRGGGSQSWEQWEKH